jgi:hypothetical protein
MMLGLILGMYAGEPCRICGENIQMGDLMDIKNGAVYAGYSECGTSRSAHKACWDKYKDDTLKWVYPKSAPIGSKN